MNEPDDEDWTAVATVVLGFGLVLAIVAAIGAIAGRWAGLW